MEIRYTYKARDDFKMLSRPVQKRIALKMRFYASQENPLEFAKRLANPEEGEFRFRIGDWRVIFDVSEEIIFVLRIKHRSEAYE